MNYFESHLYKNRSISIRCKTDRRARGFTILELMVTLVVAGLLATMAVPSFSNLIQDNRLSSQTNEFITAMMLARSEAIKRKTNISVIATDSSNAADEWGAGWRVAVTGGTTIRVFSALEGGSTLNSNGNIASFQYQSNGRINNTDTLDICDDRSHELGRRVTISPTGRVSTNTNACS